MPTHDETAGQAGESAQPDQQLAERSPCAAPSLTESLLALGLLAVTIVCCWLVYGRAIGMMPVYFEHVLGK